MAKQTINLGTTPNDRTGDKLRDAFDKCNDNFTEVYGAIDDLLEEVQQGAPDRIVSGEKELVLTNTGYITPPSAPDVGNQTEVEGLVFSHTTTQKVLGASNADQAEKGAATLGVIGGEGYGYGDGSDVRVYGGDGGLRSQEFGETPLAISVTAATADSCVISNQDYDNNSSFITLGMLLTVGENSGAITGISVGEGVLLQLSDTVFQTEGTFDASISDPAGGDFRGFGGYVRIYAGDGRGGGYVRVYGGDSYTVSQDDDEDVVGGYVRLRGGYSNTSRGGNIEIEAGNTGSDNPANNGDIRLTTSRGTIILGGWPEVGPTAPSHWHFCKDSEYLDLFFGDDYNHFKLPSSNNGAQIKTSNVAAEGQPEYIWDFDVNGRLGVPGPIVAEVTSTEPGIGNNGVVTEISVTNGPNQNWQSGSGIAIGDLNFVVTVDGGGNAWVSTINSGGTGHWVGEGFNIDGGAFGAGPGHDMTLMVTGIQEEVLSPLPVDKLLHRLSGSNYSLADGVEGQIMYFVNATNNPQNEVWVYVANGRSGQNVYTDAWFAPFQQDAGVVTAIFTEGAWNFSSGVWD